MIIYARDTYLLSLKCIGCDIARSSNHRESNDTKDVLFRMNGHSGSATSHRHTGPLRLGTLSISTSAKGDAPRATFAGQASSSGCSGQFGFTKSPTMPAEP